MLVITESGSADITTDAEYSVETVEGTGLTMYVIEWTTTGVEGTPVGYQVLTYDAPAGGGTGPAAGPVDGTLSTIDLSIDFDVDPESQITSAWLPTDDPYTNRLISGVRMAGEDADEDFHFYGLTTSWTGGLAPANLEISYIPEGVTATTEQYNQLWLPDRERNSWAIYTLPDDHTTWGSAITVQDTPTMPDLVPTDPVRFNTHEVTWTEPDWAEFYMTFHLRLNDSGGALFQDSYQWTVIVHPETESFRFADLPFPEAMDYDEVLFSGLTLRLGYSARAFDADPYADYVLYTDDEWASAHHLASFGDSRYQMTGP
jgi:hypothetical protein